MTSISWAFDNEKAMLTGELSIHTIDPVFEQKTLNAFYNKNIILDLADVKKIDTAGLAWLLCVIEQAKKTESSINFQNIPQDLLKLAKLSAVDLLLPIQT